MAISKVIFNGTTLMDVTGNTVTSSTLVSPETATKADGTEITGALVAKSASDLTASGATVTVPAGVYSTQAQKSVGSGVATSASTISGSSATITTGTNTITLSKSVSNTPRITTAGYISSGTAGSSSVSLTASITTKAAATITPGTTDQTISSGTYLTGTQTISGDANLVESNIKKDVTIFGKTGTYEGATGITRLISNDTSITPSGSYATSTYYNTSYGVKIGYMASGDIILSMKGGTSTSYEYLNFVLGTAPSGVSLTWALDTSANYATGKPGIQYACVLSGITQKSSISITMGTRDSTYDYVTVTVNVTTDS